MGLNFFVGEVQAQANAASRVAQEATQAVGLLQDAVAQFLRAPLSSKTYDTAKRYFSVAYPPLRQGVVLTSEALTQAHQKFISEYNSQVGGGDIQEDQLQERIAQGRALMGAIQDLAAKEDEFNPRLERRYENALNAVQKLEERLQKLRAFDASSAAIFSDYEACLRDLNAGISAIANSGAWNASSGTFNITKLDMKWAKPIQNNWKKREKMRKEKLKKAEADAVNTLDKHGLTKDDLVQATDPIDVIYQKYIKFAKLGLHPHTGKPLTDKEKWQFQYAAHSGALSDLIGVAGGAYAGQKAANAGFYQKSGNKAPAKVTYNGVGKKPSGSVTLKRGNSGPSKVTYKTDGKIDFGAENPVSGQDWNNYFKDKYGDGNVQWKPTSLEDIISNPQKLYGSTKNEIKSILGEGWTEASYGSAGTGWKFTNEGDGMVFYHPGDGIHGGSYYGFSTGDTGKVKIVGEDYINFSNDKATIIKFGGE